MSYSIQNKLSYIFCRILVVAHYPPINMEIKAVFISFYGAGAEYIDSPWYPWPDMAKLVDLRRGIGRGKMADFSKIS